MINEMKLNILMSNIILSNRIGSRLNYGENNCRIRLA